MHTLIVVSHPIAGSLTHTVAKQIAEGINGSEGGHSVEIADLAAEGFDPRFTPTDMNFFNGKASLPEDVIAEQQRIERADSLVLVYPIYWWSMPGLLKGWIDRVFTNGWAFYDDGTGKVAKKLPHLKVHLVALGGADMRTFARHGYFGAMKTQIDHGIFDYCGAQVITSELIHTDHSADVEANLALAKKLGQKIVATHQQAESLCA